MVSETVLLSAITAISGLGGAAFGACASIWIARGQNRMQLNRCVLEEAFRARYQAFQKVFDAENAFSMESTEDAKALLIQSVKEACVVASPYASSYMMALLALAKIDCRTAFDDIREDMLSAMQRDLVTFMEPKIEEYAWPDLAEVGHKKN